MIIVSILIMVLILTLLVVVHEWGHYIAARIFKIKINEFSIFVGPKIYSRVGKKTGTVFSIRCIPLGGFCAFEGEEKTAEGDESYCNKPWWQRTIVLLAGVFMNIVLAMVIVTVLFMINGYTTREISNVNDFMPIKAIGIEAGDSIVEYNDYSIYNYMDFNLINYAVNLDDSNIVIKKANGDKEEYRLVRNVESNSETKVGLSEMKIYRVVDDESIFIGTHTSSWQNDSLEINYYDKDVLVENYMFGKNEDDAYYCKLTNFDSEGNVISETEPYDENAVISILSSYTPYKFGFSFNYVEDANIFQCIGNAAIYNMSLVKSVFNSLKWLITGGIGLDAMSGPIGITTVVEDVVTADVSIFARIMTLFEICALISANLAAFNVLPIPGLDGGKMIFIIIELIRRGKKIPPEKEAVVSLVFLALLVLFSIVVAGNDIIRIIRG